MAPSRRWRTLPRPMPSFHATTPTRQFLPLSLRLLHSRIRAKTIDSGRLGLKIRLEIERSRTKSYFSAFHVLLPLLGWYRNLFSLSLLQNAAQSHGGAFITPAPAAATALPPAYAYYYSGGVMPGSYQFGAPALYPVSAAASGHQGSGAGAQYGKGPSLGGAGGVQGAAGGAQSAAGSGAGVPGSTQQTASPYASYGSSYDDFSKSVYGSVGVGSGGVAAQAAKIGGVQGSNQGGQGGGVQGSQGGPSGAQGSTDLSVGPNVYGKSHSQLGKINVSHFFLLLFTFFFVLWLRML